MEQCQKKHTDKCDEDIEETEPKNLQDEKLTEEIDAVLDEIDELLEPNAQEFVQQYVQKGGQ